MQYIKADRPVNWQKVFGGDAPLEVEIGFGTGDALIRIAEASSNRNFVGIEENIECIRKTLRKIHFLNERKNESEKVKNKIGIFITGATGFVGSALVVEHLLTDKYKIFCLVRKNEQNCEDRLHNAVFESAGLSGIDKELILKRIENLVAINGDITLPMLGIDEADIKEMSELGIKHLWHTAAYVNHDDYFKSKIISANVEGTKNVVAFLH